MDSDFVNAIVQSLIVFAFGVYTFWRVWVFKNRYRRTAPTVTQFAPPKGIDAIMHGVIRDGRLHSADVTAGIVTLAQKGVLAITPTTDSEKSDFAITYKQHLTADDPVYYHSLLSMLFLSPVLGQSITLSSVTSNKKAKIRNFYIFRKLKNSLYAALIDLGYIQELSIDDLFRGTLVRMLYVFFIVVVLAMVSVLLGFFLGSTELQVNVSSTLVMIVFAIPFIDMLLRWRSLTEKGADLKSQLAGFYEYLVIAEKDRYESERVLDSEVLSWREFLPYAVAFGVVTKWDEAFSSIKSLQDETGRF